MTQNLWEAAKAVLRGKFIAIQSYLKKQEISQISNLTLHLKQLEKEEQRDRKVYKQTGFFFFCLSLSFASLSRLASRLLNSSGIFS